MNLITATELRTKTNELIESLLASEEVALIHRSKIIGTISPKQGNRKPVSAKRLAKALKAFEPKKKMTYGQIRKIYDHYMIYRHGPRVS